MAHLAPLRLARLRWGRCSLLVSAWTQKFVTPPVLLVSSCYCTASSGDEHAARRGLIPSSLARPHRVLPPPAAAEFRSISMAPVPQAIPNFDQTGPGSTKSRVRPTSTNSRPESSNGCPESTGIAPESTGIGPEATKIGASLVDRGAENIDRDWSTLDGCRGFRPAGVPACLQA